MGAIKVLMLGLTKERGAKGKNKRMMWQKQWEFVGSGMAAAGIWGVAAGMWANIFNPCPRAYRPQDM